MLDLTHRGNVAVVRMAHGKANALDVELCEALTAQLEECRRRSDLGALVITGTGRMFSAGVDLPRVVSGGAPYVRTFLPALSRMLASLFSLPKPVVAAVNGHAIAGGCIMACAADTRLMAGDGGRIGIPELLVGVPFPAVPLEIMRFATTPGQVQALAYGGITLTADEALRRGVIDTVCAADRLIDDAVAVAASYAALPADAFAITKAQLREPAMERMRAGASVDAAVEDMWASDRTLAAISDYVVRTFKPSL